METFEATITSKGQVTLPVRLRSALGLKPGDRIVFHRNEAGVVQVEARTATLADLLGIVRDGPTGITGRQVERWIEDSHGIRWQSDER